MSEMLTHFSDSRHTKAEGKFTPQICRSRIFVPANECTRVVPMYPSQSAMSHLHSLAQSMYIATFLPKHVIPTCFADYVTSTSGAIRLAFDLSPWPQVLSTYLPLATTYLTSAAYLTFLSTPVMVLERMKTRFLYNRSAHTRAHTLTHAHTLSLSLPRCLSDNWKKGKPGQ